MKKRSLKFFAAVLATLMLIGACMGCKSETAPVEAPATNADVPAGNDAPDATGEAEKPADGPSKTLTIAFSENVLTLDPHRANNMTSYQVRNVVFDTLVESDHVGNFTPRLATEWSNSEDGKAVTFKLREGVSFHNGEPFTSADVVATFQRLIDDKTLPVSSTYWGLLESVEAVDDYTVILHMAQPYAGINISLINTCILPDEAWKELGEKLFTNGYMYGTGPWKFDEWADGQYFHVIKNENYWGKDKYDSYYDDIYARTVLEGSSAVAGHLSGDIQAYIASGGISADLLPLYDGAKGIDLRKIQCGSTDYIGFQCGEGAVFADRNVRLAFAHAIDRQSIVDYILGMGSVARSCMIEGRMGYTDDIPYWQYDPELAKSILADSTYDGREITLSSNTGTLKSQEILLSMSEMLNAVGFKTKVEVVESATLLEMRTTGNYDCFMVSTMQECNDPIKFINTYVKNDIHTHDYVDDDLWALINESNSTLDPAARTKLLEKILVDWANTLVHYQLFQLDSTYAIDQGIKGLNLYNDGFFDFTYVTYEG